jgi:hypothetical protein
MRLRSIAAAAGRAGLTAAAFAVLAACGRNDPSQRATPPPLLIESRGFTMPLDRAVTKIGFRPYLPPGQMLAFAVIPPLGNDDSTAHRGMAIEYVASRRAMLLSQWPKQQFTLAFGGRDVTSSPCTIVHFSADGVGWTARSGLMLTLQPDGKAGTGAVVEEARRLLRLGYSVSPAGPSSSSFFLASAISFLTF